MRKPKLQVQITADGFVAGPEGQLDWMTWEMDEKLKALISELADTSDILLLGRKMTGGFIRYWEHTSTQPESPDYLFARKMVDIPKIVFSKNAGPRRRAKYSCGKRRSERSREPTKTRAREEHHCLWRGNIAGQNRNEVVPVSVFRPSPAKSKSPVLVID